MISETTDQAKAIEIAPCPFCGGEMVECNDEDGHYWVHPGRHGMNRTSCWLADAWVNDRAEGEGSIGEWNTRAVSISRASQGLGEGTGDDVKRVTDALEPKCRGFGHGNMPRAIAEEFARTAISALSPPAAPQAPEDVISAASDIARSMTYDRALANQIISALADAHFLATPVTVTMGECRRIADDFLITNHSYSTTSGCLWQCLRRVLGDRIQIAEPQKDSPHAQA